MQTPSSQSSNEGKDVSVDSDLKVSIITVSYNAAETIEQTIRSVLQQSYRNIEYIVVDGFSTDGTQEIIEKYKNEIVHYVSEPDAGIYDAMNKGISLAAGDIVGIINSDDWYEPDAVAKIVSEYEKTPADVVYGEIWLIDKEGNRTGCTRQSVLPPHPSMFVKREAYRKYGVFDTAYQIAADYDLMLRLLVHGASFSHLEEPIANFRQTGVSNTRLFERAEETYQVGLKYVERCPDYILNRERMEESHNISLFVHIVENEPEKIYKILDRNLNTLNKGVAVWGTGEWGSRFYSLLSRWDVSILYWIDNDERKWNTEWKGIKVVQPDMLKTGTVNVIVANRKHQREICNQLQSYLNPDLFWLTLDEIQDAVLAATDWGLLE